MAADQEPFVDRWSRLKREQAAESPARTDAAAPAQKVTDEPPLVLQPIDQLTPDSDFVPFMNAKVDTATRRSALKKLFADPHYGTPDPFEVYSEDYTKSETIPLEMLKSLNQAQKLLFDEPEKKVDAAAAAADSPESPEPQQSPAKTPPEQTANAKDDAVGKQDA